MIEFILFVFVCAAIAFMVKNLTSTLNQEKTQLKSIKIKENEKTKSTKKKTDRF